MSPMDHLSLTSLIWGFSIEAASPQAAVDVLGDFSASVEGLPGALARAGRLDTGPLRLTEPQWTALRLAGVDWPLEGWTWDELLRAALLLSASARLPRERYVEMVETCYRQGDAGLRRAVLRSLAMLPGPVSFVPLALDACRGEELPVFEALACGNPFPAAHFTRHNFCQLALRAAYCGLELSRIIGLDRRSDPELSRLAASG